jgi:hypothetical protein
MNTVALALICFTLCVLPYPVATGERSAAITDLPATVDLAYADPKTWHRLPVVASDAFFTEEIGPVRFSSVSRPF